jgi:hypothetical protein
MVPKASREAPAFHLTRGPRRMLTLHAGYMLPYILTPTKILAPSPINTVPNARSIHLLARQ